MYQVGDVANSHVWVGGGWVPVRHVAADPTGRTTYALGDVANGHAWTGSGWVPVRYVPAQPLPPPSAPVGPPPGSIVPAAAVTPAAKPLDPQVQRRNKIAAVAILGTLGVLILGAVIWAGWRSSQPLTCSPATAADMAVIADGMSSPATTVNGGQVVAYPESMRQEGVPYPGFPRRLVAATIEPGGQVGLWALGGAGDATGPVGAVNGTAQSVSDWMAGANPGSPVDLLLDDIASSGPARDVVACVTGG